MKKDSAELLGTLPIPKLLIQQAIPASIGILVMSLNILIDTIFVGQWIGSNAIAAINVVLPVSFFIAALGMSIGIGGASIISRSLGKKNTLQNTRILISKLQDEASASKIRKTLSKRYENRKGGYTRIIKAGFRYGDNAPMAVIEFVDRDIEAKKIDKKKTEQSKATDKKVESPKEATA